MDNFMNAKKKRKNMKVTAFGSEPDETTDGFSSEGTGYLKLFRGTHKTRFLLYNLASVIWLTMKYTPFEYLK